MADRAAPSLFVVVSRPNLAFCNRVRQPHELAARPTPINADSLTGPRPIPAPRPRQWLGTTARPPAVSGLLGQAALVIMAGSLSSKHAAGSPDALRCGRPNLINRSPPPSWPESSRDTTSCSIAPTISRPLSKTGIVQLKPPHPTEGRSCTSHSVRCTRPRIQP